MPEQRLESMMEPTQETALEPMLELMPESVKQILKRQVPFEKAGTFWKGRYTQKSGLKRQVHKS